MPTSISEVDFNFLDHSICPVITSSMALPSGIVPRPYQSECREACHKGWSDGLKKLLVEAAGGCGKTIIFGMIGWDFVRSGQKVLILAHTDELIMQAADKLLRVTGIKAGREKAQDRASVTDDVVVSSIQTMSRAGRLETWDRSHFGLVVIDECHRALSKSYINIMHHFDSAKVLGVSATLDRGDQRSLLDIFDKVVYQYGLPQAVRDGWLVRPIAKTVPLKVDIRGVRTKKGPNGNDLSADELSSKLEPFLQEIAEQLIVHTEGRKTALFLPSVDTAISLAKKLRSLGACADFVSGDKARCPDRKDKMVRFHDGKIRIMCNALLMVEGVDDDEISCVCVLRATKIRSMFVQCSLRGTRPLTGTVDGLETAEERRAAIAASAKPDMLLLDFLWLTERLDLVHPAYLVTGAQETLTAMKGKQGDLLEIQQQEERDLLASLKKEAKKYSRRKGRTFDPLEMAIKLGDEQILNYKPEFEFEKMPMTAEQAEILTKNGVDLNTITCAGMASRWIALIDRRSTAGLCSLKQMNFLDKHGFKDQTSYMSREEAKGHFLRTMNGFRRNN